MKNIKWSASLIRDIVDNIRDPEGNRIIPIIGQGVFYVVDEEKEYSIQQFIVKKVLANEKIPIQPTEDNIEEYSNGYKGMTELSKMCYNNGLTLRLQIKEIFRNENNKIKLDPDIISFLQRGEFPLILTTCNFQWMENYIMYQGKKYSVVPYRTGKDKDIETEDGKITNPTIFHLFGLVGQDRNVVITENDFLKYLHCIQDTNTRPERLKEYLKNKYILSLGCEIPDWTFRFLLFSLKEIEGKLEGNSGEDAFDGGALSKAMDDNLSSYLSNISYFPSQRINEFIRDINDRLEPEKKPSVFLSVNSEEYEIGDRVKRILSPKFNVWFFKDDGGVQYWKDIEEGINSCDFFIPLTTSRTLSKMYAEKAQKGNDEAGIIREMRLALNKKEKKGENKYCFPLLYGVDRDLLQNTLLNSKCEDLVPLFFAKEGNAHIEVPSEKLEKLTAEQVWNHIMS